MRIRDKSRTLLLITDNHKCKQLGRQFVSGGLLGLRPLGRGTESRAGEGAKWGEKWGHNRGRGQFGAVEEMTSRGLAANKAPSVLSKSYTCRTVDCRVCRGHLQRAPECESGCPRSRGHVEHRGPDAPSRPQGRLQSEPAQPQDLHVNAGLTCVSILTPGEPDHLLDPLEVVDAAFR